MLEDDAAPSVPDLRYLYYTMYTTARIFFSNRYLTYTAYLYYKNCAVRVTKDEVTPIDYLDLGGYVWKDHVIDRTFKICDGGSSVYRVFINNVCAQQSSRAESMESTIGFLLHAHKNLSYCPAIILNDEVISDNPEGGTGRGYL